MRKPTTSPSNVLAALVITTSVKLAVYVRNSPPSEVTYNVAASAVSSLFSSVASALDAHASENSENAPPVEA